MIALMAIVLFSSCKKDDDSTGNNVMSAKNVINSIPDIASVKAVMYDNSIKSALILATVPYQNNGFNLTLKVPPATCMYEVEDELDPEYYNITISDPKAKIGGVEVAAFNNNDEEIGGFYNWGTNTRTYAEANYVYADRNFTVKGQMVDPDDGEYLGEYNCSFKKGWNIIYTIAQTGEETTLITTQKPSEITMEWEFDNYLFWKSNKTLLLNHKSTIAKRRALRMNEQ